MKKIDNLAANAFNSKTSFNSRNTKVVITNGEAYMYLFNNLIAKTENGQILMTNAGWFTVTTKNRLNALGASIRLSKGQFIVNEKFNWGGEWILLNNSQYNIKS
jgi:hypothetical protein